MKFNSQTMLRTVLGAMILVLFAWVGQRAGQEQPARHSDQPIAPSAVAPGATETVPTTTPLSSATGSLSPPSTEAADAAGSDFDFYVLSLSWSPTHCASEAGTGRDDDLQCRSGRAFGFVLHGLWPQNERGWPENCPSDAPRRVAKIVLEQALMLTPSTQLIQHEWEKHGTCSGLSQEDYFAAAALAVERVNVPKAYKQPQKPKVTTANAVKRAFIDANPSLSEAGILVTCRRNEIGEVRVCLDKELQPRACSRDTLKSHCGGRDARMLDVRGTWPRN